MTDAGDRRTGGGAEQSLQSVRELHTQRFGAIARPPERLGVLFHCPPEHEQALLSADIGSRLQGLPLRIPGGARTGSARDGRAEGGEPRARERGGSVRGGADADRAQHRICQQPLGRQSRPGELRQQAQRGQPRQPRKPCLPRPRMPPGHFLDIAPPLRAQRAFNAMTIVLGGDGTHPRGERGRAHGRHVVAQVAARFEAAPGRIVDALSLPRCDACQGIIQVAGDRHGPQFSSSPGPIRRSASRSIAACS